MQKMSPAGSFLVRERGLEPPRHNHTHLKRACLPFQHSRKRLCIIPYIPLFVNPFSENWLVLFSLNQVSMAWAWLPLVAGLFFLRKQMGHNGGDDPAVGDEHRILFL